MKNIFIILLVIHTISGFAQSKEWRIGIQFGMHGSQSVYSGGMADAHARFSSNSFAAPSLDISARYDLNEKWMFLSGLGFSQTGFDFAIAENYSLLGKERKYTSIRSSIPLVQIPMIAAYKTNLNCRNIRYFIGCGLVLNFTGDSITNSYTVTGNEVTMPDTSYLNSIVSNKKQTTIDPRFVAGCEKLFKKGGILSISFLAHFGTQQLMHATVNYTIDGTRYWHEFKNNGMYCGIVFSYFFKNFGWEKQHISEKIK